MYLEIKAYPTKSFMSSIYWHNEKKSLLFLLGCTACDAFLVFNTIILLIFVFKFHIAGYVKKIKSSLYSRYYDEACNEWRGSSPLLSAWTIQLRRNVATMASRWRHCADLNGPGIEPQTFRTDSVRLATELTGYVISVKIKAVIRE